MLGGFIIVVYLCSCERTGENRVGLGGVKHAPRRVNARVCVAENHVPVDLWLHHQRRRAMRDEDPTCEIWMLAKKDPNLSLVLVHDERGQGWSLSAGFVDIQEKGEHKSLLQPW